MCLWQSSTADFPPHALVYELYVQCGFRGDKNQGYALQNHDRGVKCFGRSKQLGRGCVQFYLFLLFFFLSFVRCALVCRNVCCVARLRSKRTMGGGGGIRPSRSRLIDTAGLPVSAGIAFRAFCSFLYSVFRDKPRHHRLTIFRSHARGEHETRARNKKRAHPRYRKQVQ